MKRVAWILTAGILWMLLPAGGYAEGAGVAPIDAPEDTRNYAGPGLGARFSPGVKTEFLEPWGLDAFVTKGALIFRHGPRDLEKVIIVTLAQPVRVRAASFGTAYEDIVRCPTGCEVFASETGVESSYRRVGGTNEVRGDRTLIPIEPPVVARYVKFTFTDSGGGTRITELGVYTGTPERVRQAGGFEPWPPGPQPDWITPDAITAAAREGEPRGDMELTFYATGLDYSAPAIPGEGSLLERF
ncbi:MAG TPA: discoidin domain-containing protein, partial [Armatimonadetes bacterium]|nr:discoidin domain-containing protein [Armatimonadota bacterium]